MRQPIPNTQDVLHNSSQGVVIPFPYVPSRAGVIHLVEQLAKQSGAQELGQLVEAAIQEYSIPKGLRSTARRETRAWQMAKKNQPLYTLTQKITVNQESPDEKAETLLGVREHFKSREEEADPSLHEIVLGAIKANVLTPKEADFVRRYAYNKQNVFQYGDFVNQIDSLENRSQLISTIKDLKKVQHELVPGQETSLTVLARSYLGVQEEQVDTTLATQLAFEASAAQFAQHNPDLFVQMPLLENGIYQTIEHIVDNIDQFTNSSNEPLSVGLITLAAAWAQGYEKRPQDLAREADAAQYAIDNKELFEDMPAVRETQDHFPALSYLHREGGRFTKRDGTPLAFSTIVKAAAWVKDNQARSKIDPKRLQYFQREAGATDYALHIANALSQKLIREYDPATHDYQGSPSIKALTKAFSQDSFFAKRDHLKKHKITLEQWTMLSDSEREQKAQELKIKPVSLSYANRIVNAFMKFYGNEIVNDLPKI